MRSRGLEKSQDLSRWNVGSTPARVLPAGDGLVKILQLKARQRIPRRVAHPVERARSVPPTLKPLGQQRVRTLVPARAGDDRAEPIHVGPREPLLPELKDHGIGPQPVSKPSGAPSPASATGFPSHAMAMLAE